jgi:hypothetical protein
MTYLIIYAVSIVPMMLAIAYVAGRLGDTHNAGWAAVYGGIFWPIALPIGAAAWACWEVARLGEKHAAQRQQINQKH